MKNKLLYILLIVFFTISVGFIVLKHNNNEQLKAATEYNLLPRKGDLVKADDWTTIQKSVALLKQKIKADPADKKSLIALANTFILEGRATGNFAYYDVAAMRLVNDILKIDSNNFDALTLQSLIYLSQHHFSDGLATAEKAASIIPFNAFVQGILVDGNVEMGKYDSAVLAAQRMMDIRPDLRSYARASYLREIYGDYPGAIEAMKLAIDAGAPGDEATEWSRIQLGHLYENIGDLQNAKMQYQIALEERPGYMHALAGMARLSMAAKDYNSAIGFYQQAAKDANEGAFQEELATVYLLAGNTEKAAALTNKVIDDLDKNATAANNDESIGHYSDKELAYAYLQINKYDKALDHALIEYNRRPANIEVNETLAWAYYKKGDAVKAETYLPTALKTNSKNPTLLCRAGLIYLKNGNSANAVKYLRDGLQNNPNIDGQLKAEASNTLKSIKL